MAKSTGDNTLDTTPNGFHIQHDAVQSEVWQTIRHWLSTNSLPPSKNSESVITISIPWETGAQMQHRKIAQFGNCKYDYIRDAATACGETSPIPQYIRETLLSVHENEKYTQCIINWYDASNEIPWHLDHEYFGPEVLVYTFGEDRPLLFRRPNCLNDSCNTMSSKEDAENKSIAEQPQSTKDTSFSYVTSYPRHCSKYILKGPARNEWEHSVPSGKAERVSITFRSWNGHKDVP
jgi:hypothetical protein